MQKVLDIDLKDCISKCFDKLDINGEHRIEIKTIKMALETVTKMQNTD